MFATLATLTLTNMSTMTAWIFQEPVAWDPLSLWHQMGYVAKGVVVILDRKSVV